MAILGGSPLGLIGVKSSPVQGTGMSTFNGGSSRNISVDKYNSAKNPNSKKKGTESILSGKTTISPYGNIGSIGTDNGGGSGMAKGTYGGVNKDTLHNNSVYDTSLLNIIERLSGTVAALRPGDFAYLKDIGVYPNNRLMIARRFLSPHTDNIYGKSKGVSSVPMAVMISWKTQEDNFIDIDFGEEWIPANADFTNVMNSLGEEFGMKGKMGLGTIGEAAFNVTTLPGFAETLQRKILSGMGILDNDGDEKSLPTGNPNLIKEAKRRKNVPYTEAGSGLKCSVSIKMTCEWEQKFISGIDPTIVFQDLIATILRFGTSRSDFYGLSGSFEKKVEKWVNNPETFANDFIGYITTALTNMTENVKAAIEGFLGENRQGVPPEKQPTATEVATKNNSAIDDAIAKAKSSFDDLVSNIGTALKKSIQKYRLEIEGIARSLSGMPSTPWHITIGNPLRPVFCAGDMYMGETMKLTLGPNLSFNDLPSSIIADFTLTNARPWGLQEIMSKFNAGSLRVSNGLKDSNSLKPNESLMNGITDNGEPLNDTGATSSNTGGVSSSVPGNSNQSSTSNVKNKAEQRPKLESVNVIQTGSLTTEQKKLEEKKREINSTTNTINVNPVENTTKTMATSTTLNSVNVTATAVSETSSAASTTKIGSNAGEQINKDATSETPVTIIDISSKIQQQIVVT